MPNAQLFQKAIMGPPLKPHPQRQSPSYTIEAVAYPSLRLNSLQRVSPHITPLLVSEPPAAQGCPLESAWLSQCHHSPVSSSVPGSSILGPCLVWHPAEDSSGCHGGRSINSRTLVYSPWNCATHSLVFPPLQKLSENA